MTILEHLNAAFNPWYEPKSPTPLEIASQQLAETERGILDAEYRRDRVDSECTMLRARRNRLKARVHELTATTFPPLMKD